MPDEPVSSPIRQDKTTERMAQERQSPGATSAGGLAADALGNDTDAASGSFEPAEPSATSANVDARRGDREERVREAAYRISQSRGATDGDPVADWLQAEAEVDAQASDRTAHGEAAE